MADVSASRIVGGNSATKAWNRGDVYRPEKGKHHVSL